jgi:hypothetical protein
MSVRGVGGPEPLSSEPEDDQVPADVPELASVRGQPEEDAMRRGLETAYGGALNRAAGILDDVLSLVGVRPLTPRIEHDAIERLPSFEVDARDGTKVSCALDEVAGPDGKKRPGVSFEWKPLGEPGLRFKFAEGAPRSLFGGLMREAPLSLRHAVRARHALETIRRHLEAAARPGAPLGPGATREEVLRAVEIVGRISSEVGELESIAARSPEAKLVMDVYAALQEGKLDDTGALEKAIADLEAAAASADGRTALSPAERASVKDEIANVRRMAEEWLRASSRTGTYS